MQQVGRRQKADKRQEGGRGEEVGGRRQEAGGGACERLLWVHVWRARSVCLRSVYFEFVLERALFARK